MCAGRLCERFDTSADRYERLEGVFVFAAKELTRAEAHGNEVLMRVGPSTPACFYRGAQFSFSLPSRRARGCSARALDAPCGMPGVLPRRFPTPAPLPMHPRWYPQPALKEPRQIAKSQVGVGACCVDYSSNLAPSFGAPVVVCECHLHQKECKET